MTMSQTQADDEPAILDAIRETRWALAGKEHAPGPVWATYRFEWSALCRVLAKRNGGKPTLTAIKGGYTPLPGPWYGHSPAREPA